MSGELPTECCAKCRFWWSNAKDSYGEQDGIYGDNYYAACRRFPKVRVDKSPTGFAYEGFDFPVMIDSDWCGEFQPRPDVPPG